MKGILILVSLFAVIMGLSNAFSQEMAADKTLTLEECIQVALKNRPELEMATLDIFNAEHQIKEATSYYYPRLNFNAGYTRFNRPTEFDFDVDITEIKNRIPPPFGLTLPDSIQQEVEIGKTNWFSVSLDLNQPVYTFGRIGEGVKQARIGHSIAINQREKKRGEIIYEVKKGYFQLLLAKEIQQLMKEAEARANVVARMVKIDYETSIPEKEERGTTRLDYLKAKNFHSEVKARLSEAGKNLKLAQLALKMAVGIRIDQPLRVAEVALESLPMDMWDLREMKERTLRKNLDLKNLELGVLLYDSKRKAANREYLPKIGIQGQYVGPEDRFGTRNFWYAGIGITMPIFDGFSTKAKIGQTEAQFHKARSQKFLLESGLSVQIDQLNSTLMELQERVKIFQMAIQEAQERVQLAADGYSAGITEYDELLFAQRTELEMRSAYLQVLYLYHVTQSEVEFISGEI